MSWPGLSRSVRHSQMPMQDKNSDQVAEVIQKWLAAKGLSD
jgi:hypothetical protein